jgi:dTDP-4-amino-4,6-dideoxygalactose transaminase
MNIPALDLKRQYVSLKDKILPRIAEVFENQAFILGKEVEKLEKDIASYCGVKYGIGCASGSDALLLALLALGVGEGDEVITTPFTFFATVSAIVRVGARPVFVDIREDTFNLDENLIEEKITDKTKAILPVHLFGQPAKMDTIMEIAHKHSLFVLEDAAQSIGSEFSGKRAGSWGDLTAISFYPTKNLGGAGDGGMIVTDNKELAEKIRILRVHGASGKYFHEYLGINSRLDALQAVVLQEKLNFLESWHAGRRQNAYFYNKKIQESPVLRENIRIPQEQESVRHVYNQYSILTEKRDELQTYLKEKGVGTAVYYPLPHHLQKVFSFLGYAKGDFPVSERISQKILSLPVYPELTEDEKKYIISTLEEFYK